MSIIGSNVIYPELSYRIIKIAFDIDKKLGYGYQEKIYQKAFERNLMDEKIEFVAQCPYKIVFRNQIVGRYYIDLVINKKIIVEFKVGDYFLPKNIKQVYGYLKATNLQLGILINFTKEGVKYKRIANIN